MQVDLYGFGIMLWEMYTVRHTKRHVQALPVGNGRRSAHWNCQWAPARSAHWTLALTLNGGVYTVRHAQCALDIAAMQRCILNLK